MSEADRDRDRIAEFVSNVILNGFGFGPSMNTCRLFVDQVIAEAATVGQTLRIGGDQ